MKQIRITRDASGVKFDKVVVDSSENVFFTNLDSQSAHWPSISSNQLGPAPSPNSSQCQPDSPDAEGQSFYHCQIEGHGSEQGVIIVVDVMTAANTTLDRAVKGQSISEQVVVTGGLSPYSITNRAFQVLDGNNQIVQQGSGIGPGLRLKSRARTITVSGTPTVSGTYIFTFEVNDAAGHNLQQAQYTMTVA